MNIRPYYYKVEDKRLAELSGGMESCLASLAKEQAAYILANLELSPILTIITHVRGVIVYAMGCLCTQAAYILANLELLPIHTIITHVRGVIMYIR